MSESRKTSLGVGNEKIGIGMIAASLAVPRIDDMENITLQIHPEVSTGAISADGIPSQKTTEVTTEILTHDGQPIFIGGLIKNNITEGRESVPILGSIPLLGALFSSESRASNNTETVVLITPYVVGGRAHKLMLEKLARIQQQELLLAVEPGRIGSEMDPESADQIAVKKRAQFDNDWDDPALDGNSWDTDY